MNIRIKQLGLKVIHTKDISKNNKSLHIRLKDVSEASQSKKVYLKKIYKLILN